MAKATLNRRSKVDRLSNPKPASKRVTMREDWRKVASGFFGTKVDCRARGGARRQA